MKDNRGRLAVASVLAAGIAFTAAEADAHPFGHWSGKKGPFRWEAKRLSCGAVGGAPSTIRAHTLWRTSPANGYARLRFTRQIRTEDGSWVSVQRPRLVTRNTRFEGTRRILHWSQRMQPFANEGGVRSRHIVVVEFLRDRPGRDRLILRRVMRFRPCTVGA